MRRQRLAGKAFEGFVEVGGGAGAGDDDGDARGRRREFGKFDVLVVADEPEAVEDGEGVRHHRADGGEGEGAHLVAEVHLDRRLAHLVAVRVGDGEHLKIEGEAFDEHAVEGPLQGLAPEELHAGLGVGRREADEQLDDAVVDPTGESAHEGIVDLGIGMAFGADDDVGAVAEHDVEEAGNLLGKKVEIGVEEEDVRAAAEVEAVADGVALAGVGVENQRADDVGRLVRDRLDGFGRAIAAAVVDHDDLEGDLAGEEVTDAADVAGDGACKPIRRHHDAQKTVWA